MSLKLSYQDRAKRAEAEIIHGSLFYFKPISHLALKLDPRARRAAPCRDKISATRHQWSFARGRLCSPGHEYDAPTRSYRIPRGAY